MTATAEGPRRADIQGLRGVAVLAVVLFHAGLPLPGGFLGVDVFFVISGLVIGRLLLDELASSGGLHLPTFYARRARRLLPALALMTLVVLPLVCLTLDPFGQQQEAANTAREAQVFVANLQLYRHTGYADALAAGTDANPFLHLWSLSVEEQFYLLLPVTLLGAWRLGRRRRPDASRSPIATVRWVVAMATLASFVLSWLLSTGRWSAGLHVASRFAFFSAPTRAWQLGVGVLLATVPTPTVTRSRSTAPTLVAMAAAGAVGWSFVAIESDTALPGLAAVAPVLGAAALLWSGARSTRVAAVLGVAPLRRIGDVSYAWYLWHWPLMVVAAATWPASGAAPVLAAAVSLPLAVASTRWLETPLRRDTRIVGVRAVALGMGCVAVVWGAIGVARPGMARGWGVEAGSTEVEQPAGRRLGCHALNRDDDRSWPADACTFGPGPVDVLLLGDTSAAGALEGVLLAARSVDATVATWTHAACPFLDRPPGRAEGCRRWQRAAWDLVERLRPHVVVIANQGPRYVDPEPGRRGVTTSDGPGPVDRAAALAAWSTAVDATLARLDRAGAGVVVVGAVPDFGTRFPFPSPLRPRPDVATVTRDQVVGELGPVAAIERAAVDRVGGRFVDPVPLLCPDDCRAEVGGRPWWVGAAELGRDGSRRMTPALRPALDALLARR